MASTEIVRFKPQPWHCPTHVNSSETCLASWTGFNAFLINNAFHFHFNDFRIFYAVERTWTTFYASKRNFESTQTQVKLVEFSLSVRNISARSFVWIWNIFCLLGIWNFKLFDCNQRSIAGKHCNQCFSVADEFEYRNLPFAQAHQIHRNTNWVRLRIARTNSQKLSVMTNNLFELLGSHFYK